MEQKSTFWKSAMIYGLYFGVAITFYSVILYVLGLSLNENIKYLSFLLSAVGVVIVQINYRNRELDGVISYGQALGFGVAVILIGSIITSIYSFIIFSIDPSLIEQIKIAQEEAMLKKGMSEDQIEAGVAMFSKMSSPGIMAIFSLFGSLFFGTIISLVTSIFVKRQPNMDAFDEAMEDIKIDE